ncbi:hypothetical protein HDV01_000681 [Terramyces sp. JEL0728]|nr:hypothetical protein HDV01_000681 [Terramyces sp. JEL0728]
MRLRVIRRLVIVTVLITIGYMFLVTLDMPFAPTNCYQKYYRLDSETISNFKNCVENLTQNYNYTDLNNTRDLLLNYKLINDAIAHEETGALVPQLQAVGKLIEDTPLFDWYQNRTVKSMYNTFQGRGMVFSVFDDWFPTAYLAILQIRMVHKSEIPIYVYHNGTKEELSIQNIQRLTAVLNVHVMDLQEIYDYDKVKFETFGIKAAAIFAAPCEECIFLDSDAWLVQPPEVIFNQNGYKETGLLLFKDRTKDQESEGLDWVKQVVPKSELKKLENFRIMQGVSLHEAESGMVVINKKRRFISMIAIAYMNELSIQPQTYFGFYGDKETFWIASALVMEPFSFDPHFPLTIGNYDPEFKDGMFCTSQMGHMDDNGNLLWVHGGLTANKALFNSTLQVFNHWSVETGKGYDWSEEDELMCMSVEEADVNNIADRDKLIINSTIKIWTDIIVPLLE